MGLLERREIMYVYEKLEQKCFKSLELLYEREWACKIARPIYIVSTVSSVNAFNKL